MSRAVLRPIREDDQQIMEYYIPAEDDLQPLEQTYMDPISEKVTLEVAEVQQEEDGPKKARDIFPSVKYDRIRTYEVISQHQTNKEVLISFHEEIKDEMPASDEPMRKKRKGVYFKEINMRTLLRKTRVQVSRFNG